MLFRRQPKKALVRAVLCVLPPVLCAVFLLGYTASGRELTYQVILNYTPTNPFLAACMMLMLFAVKSLTVVFPIIVIKIAVGHLFPIIPACLINFLGTVICLTIPYWNGRRRGGEAIDRLSDKHAKLAAFMEKQRQHAFFLCFVTRLIGCLPGDVVGMYLGAMGIPFATYLTAGVLGTVPGVLAATLVGSSLSEPDSPLFLFSIILTACLAVGSIAAYWLYIRRHKQKEEQLHV